MDDLSASGIETKSDSLCPLPCHIPFVCSDRVLTETNSLPGSLIKGDHARSRALRTHRSRLAQGRIYSTFSPKETRDLYFFHFFFYFFIHFKKISIKNLNLKNFSFISEYCHEITNTTCWQ